MDIKRMMNAIIKNGKEEDMEMLGDMFVDLAYNVKYCDHEKFKDIKYKLYKMAYGHHLTEETAKKWVSKMENKDGSYGEHWSMEQTTPLAGKHNHNDWYAILNSVYSDYFNPKFSTEDYVRLANDWIDDEDSVEDKIVQYYFYVVKHDL